VSTSIVPSSLSYKQEISINLPKIKKILKAVSETNTHHVDLLHDAFKCALKKKYFIRYNKILVHEYILFLSEVLLNLPSSFDWLLLKL